MTRKQRGRAGGGRTQRPAARPQPAGRRLSDPVLVAAIGCSALLLRLVYLAQLARTPLIHSPGLDCAYYLEQARAIAGGDWVGSEVFFMGPLYPYVLALLSFIVGFQPTPLLLAQSVLGSLSSVLVYLIGCRLFDRMIAVLAALATAAYGMLILYDNQFLMEWLLALLGLGTILALATAESRPGRLVLGGILLGLMALGRGSILLFVPCALAWLWIGARNGGPRAGRAVALRSVLAFSAGVALAVTPVTVRNAVVGSDWVLISSNGGLNLFIGNNPYGRGTYMPLDQVARAVGVQNIAVDVSAMITDPSGRRTAEAALRRPLKPSEVSDFFAERTRDYVRAQPGRALQILGRKLLLFWNATEIAQIEDPALYRDLIPLLRAPLVGFGIAGPLALLGLVFALRRHYRRRLLLIVLYVAAFTASVVLFFVTARYRAPLVPVLLLLAAFAAVELVRTARRGAARGGPALFRALALPLILLAGFSAAVHLDLVEIDRGAAYISLGIALVDEGRHDEAIAAFERAIDAAPGDPVARYNLGAAYVAAGRPREAAAVFEEAVTRTPSSAASWSGLGESYARLGNAPGAAQAFRRALMLEPRNPELWMRLGGVEMAAGRPDSALAALARGLALDPGNPTMRRMRDEILRAAAGLNQ